MYETVGNNSQLLSNKMMKVTWEKEGTERWALTNQHLDQG